MKKLLLTTVVLVLLLHVCAHAQNKKKPGFAFNAATIAELGATAEQKQKLDEITQYSRIEATKLQAEAKEIDVVNEKRQDSVFTAAQKTKVTGMREAIVAENKANPALRKVFVVDQKVSDELGLSAEQQQKLKAIGLQYGNLRWNSAQKWGKLSTKIAQDQENVFTPVQKQKIAEMKAAIIEYNKTAQ